MIHLIRPIETITAEIKVFEQSMKESVARHAWEIGKRLSEAKEILPHGSYTDWVDENFEFTNRYAREFMKFHEQNRNLSSVFDGLDWTKIRQVMSLPESIDRQDFLEQPHTVPSTGEFKTVNDMTVKELREVKKSLQEAELRAKQAEAARQLAINQHSQQQDKLLAQIDELKKKKAPSATDKEELARLASENAKLNSSIIQIQEDHAKKMSAIDSERHDLRKLREALKNSLLNLQLEQSSAIFHFSAISNKKEAQDAIQDFMNRLNNEVRAIAQKWDELTENNILIGGAGNDARGPDPRSANIIDVD